jgi:hypothetical protein
VTGIVLDGLYNEFPSGRWVVFSGERDDIPNVTGVKGVELLMVAGLRQVDPLCQAIRSTLPCTCDSNCILVQARHAHNLWQCRQSHAWRNNE